MSYQTYEVSQASGSPIELYDIAIASETFHFTSGEDSWTFGITVYEPVEVSRSEISIGPDERTGIVNIMLPASHVFVRKYIQSAPGSKATMSIWRMHRTDTPTFERTLIWKGLVRSVAFTRQGEEASMGVMPITGALGRAFPRFTYQSLCNHTVYDTGCKVDSGVFTYSANVTAVVNDQITVPGLTAKGAGWAIAGYVTDQQNRDFRLVIAQSGDVLKLLLPFSAEIVTVGTSVDVVAGCDHTIATCKTKFNNVINYGGFQFVPTKNPFATGL